MGRQKYILLLLLCFAFLELIHHHHVIGMSRRNERNCIVTNAKNEHWRLRWEEQFDDDLTGWNLQGGRKGHVESHNLKENSFLYNGNLVLVAKYSPNDPINSYSGAILNSPILHPQNFTSANVRFEIRAALPLGTQIGSYLFGEIPIGDEEVLDYKWLHVLSNVQRPEFLEGAFCELEDIQEKEKCKALDLTNYQRYGLHWNGSRIVNSFLNDYNTIEKVIREDSTQTSDPKEYQLVFAITIGGRNFYQPLPLNFKDLKWPCPAMIVDYIRVYEKVELVGNIPQCEFQDEADNDVLEGICQMALELSSVPGSNSGSNIGLILVISTVILAMLLVFVYYIKKSGILGASKSTGREENLVIENAAFVNE